MLHLLVPVILGVKPNVRIVLGGDLMLNRAIPGPATLGGMRALFRSGDAAFANLEIPLTSATATTSRKSAEEIRRKDQWVLKAATGHGRYIAEAGIGGVSLGNNHCMDSGPAGLAEMSHVLKRAGIVHAGAGRNAKEASAVHVVCTRSGVRVGLVSALAFMTPKAQEKTTPASATEAGIHVLALQGRLGKAERAGLKRWLDQARTRCDYLVVAVHWGTERKTVPNAYQVALGRALADAGADVVWGHHPHVLQGAEIYRRVPILYSMGNLVSSLPGDTGLIRLGLGKRKSVEFFPAHIAANRCLPVTGPGNALAKRRFIGLCQAIQAKYPSPDSCLPNLG